jgi:homoserine kinase
MCVYSVSCCRSETDCSILIPPDDTIGMAVDLWSEVTVERADTFEITAEGEGAAEMPKDETNYMVIGCKAAFEAANKPLPILKYHVFSRVPFARGLGSSSAAIVAGIIAGLILAGHRLPCWGSEALLQIAAGIEGHPDNVAPVIYGGIQVGIHNGTRWVTERVPCPAGLQLVMFIPDFIGKTSDARSVLQPTISREDAAYNISRVAFLVHALCVGNLDNLKWGVEDRLHQPQRGGKLYKYLYPMIEAAENAGAACAYLSGAGPTVMAITAGASGDIFAQREKERSDLAVAKAMRQAAKEFGVQGQVVVTNVSNEGARVVKVVPPFSTGGITYRDNI